MSSKELEDKYLTLLEQHLQLKSDLNSREEKLKVLSTKLQRVSNQHKSENSCTCKYSVKLAHTLQDVIAKQKYKIEDLELENLGLKEKIRILKMNLSTQRQFLGTTGSIKRFHSVSGVGSLGTARKPQSHCSVQSIKQLEKIVSPSSSTKRDSIKENLKNAVNLKKTIDLESSKVSKGIQTNDEGRQTQVNLTVELHQKIANLEKELDNERVNFDNKIMSLGEEQKSLVLERDAALSRANLQSQQQTERADCWNKVAAEQLTEILDRNKELITQLFMERKKVSDLELKLKDCVYTTQLVDLVYNRLQHDKYICRVCKTLEEVVEENGLRSLSRTDFTISFPEFNRQDCDDPIIKTENHCDNPDTAIRKLNAIINGGIVTNKNEDMVPYNEELKPEGDEVICKEASIKSGTSPPLAVPEKQKDTVLSAIAEEAVTGAMKNHISGEEYDDDEEKIPFPIESTTRQRTPLIVKLPSTSGQSEDDDDVVTGPRRDSTYSEEKVTTNTEFDEVQGEMNLEQCEDVCETETKKNENKTSPSGSETSQGTKTPSQVTYTIKRSRHKEYTQHGMKQNEPRNIKCGDSDKTEEGSLWLCEDHDTCSVSDSSVTLSEGERPALDDVSTSTDYSSHIQSSGWSQQFKSTERLQNSPSNTNPDEVCVLVRAKRVLSAVSEVLTECRDLQGKARMMSADVNITTLH